MSFDTPRKSAETILETWAGLPVAYDNVAFDSTAQAEWVRVTVLDGDSFNAALGSACVRSTGLVTVQVFTEQSKGSAGNRKYADQIAALFNGIVDDGVTYHAASLTRVGHSEDFYQMNVTIPFQHDIH